MLGLIGTEPAGQILVELGYGPLRTKQLAERVRDFSPRSVYRCVGKMERYGLVGRYEEPGIPSKVLLKLTTPLGRNLFRLLGSFEAISWGEMCMLGELWETGFVEELSWGPKVLMEFLERPHHLTYHQVKRRIGMAVEHGLLEVLPCRGNSRLYELTDRGRRQMALVAGVGRWRHRHLLSGEASEFEIEEMATVLRAMLPLAPLPSHPGMRIDLIVTGAEEYGHRATATVPGLVGPEGGARFDPQPTRAADGSAAATINIWFAALLDGNRGRIRARGDLGLVDACLRRLYEAPIRARPASTGRGGG